MLRLLQQQQIIDQELYDMLSARPLGVQPRGGVISPQPAFMQLVRQELQAKLGDKVKDLSGVKIFALPLTRWPRTRQKKPPWKAFRH